MDKRTLCPACETCPEVALEGDAIHIGQIVVPMATWNGLVDAIKEGRPRFRRIAVRRDRVGRPCLQQPARTRNNIPLPRPGLDCTAAGQTL